MDNLTHSLIGVLAGETLARTLPAAKSGLAAQARRGLIVGVMAVGSNLPDLDFLPGMITHNKLDYLLQHRGYTHTVVGAVLIALLLFAACVAWIRFRKWHGARSDYLALFGIALLAPLLHIAMDFGNNYGVHPFWPFYNGWLYGDSIFIIEPLFWAAAAPLVFLLRTIAARVLVALVLVAGIGVSVVTGMVPTSLVIALTLLTLAMLVVGRYAAPRPALLTGIAVWIVSTAMFATAGRVAAAQIAKSTGPALDRILAPLPVNPICWEVVLVQTAGDRYFLRQATFSLAPRWIPANTCPSHGVPAAATAPVVAIEATSSPFLKWRGEVVLPTRELKKIASQSCQAAALLRFARAPFFTQHIVGDLRYDREPGTGFAEVDLDKDECPSFAAPWTPPREDLLQATEQSGRSSPHK